MFRLPRFQLNNSAISLYVGSCKMAMLIIAAPSSSHTVYSDKPLELVAPRFVSPLSCTLYNSWHNLKHPGASHSRKNGVVQHGTDRYETLQLFSIRRGYDRKDTKRRHLDNRSRTCKPLRHECEPRYGDHQNFCSTIRLPQYLLHLLRHP